MAFVCSSGFSIICCTETWLTESTYNAEFVPSGYAVYRKDRCSKGGGVMIVVHESIGSCFIDSPCDLEAVTVSVGTPSVTLCTVYNPPSATDLYHRSLISYLSSLSSSSHNLIIVGDFNFPDICWASLLVQMILPISFATLSLRTICSNSFQALLTSEETRLILF